MVVNRRIADTSFLPAPTLKVKIKKPLMENGVGAAVGGRRVKFATIATPSIRGSNTINTTTTTTTTAQPTTHQKVRRILEEHADRQDRSQKGQRPVKTSSSSSTSPCIVSNYSIVASRGELARNSFSVCETPALKPNKKKPLIANNESKELAKEDNLKTILFGRKQLKTLKQDDVNSRLKNGRLVIKKSASVPSNLKDGGPANAKIFHKLPEEGLLKKSSAFLANLTSSGHRNYSENNCFQNFSFRSNKCTVPDGCQVLEKLPNHVLKKSSKIAASSNFESGERALQRSPSLQTLLPSWKKPASVGVKKSVSFRSDTSFEGKGTSPYKKTAVHEAKVYRKGVLQDRAGCEKGSRDAGSAYAASSFGGPKALLMAAREADDATLKILLNRAKILGNSEMDLNAVDSSGRSAVSYMAGNGAIAMLEAALCFPNVDVNLPDNEGNTPLHFAAQAGQIECLNALLQNCPGIEVDARNILGFTPLMKAALQGRTKCAKMLLFAGANPTMRDHGRGLRAEQWARFCGRYVCAEVIERFARHRLLERTTSCRWGSEPELAARVLQGKVTPMPTNLPPPPTGIRSKIRRVFRTNSGPDRSFSLVSQLTSAALCASSPALPKPGDVPPVVKSLLRPLSVPQLRITLVAPAEIIDKSGEKYGTSFTEKIVSEKTDGAIVKPPRTKKKNK